jgi:hypothetical protein
MTRRILAALALALAALTGCTTDDDTWTRGYPPCAQEDSPGPCYWDAQERGNGTGHSFVVHPDGVYEYTNK